MLCLVTVTAVSQYEWFCFVLNQEPADENPTTNTSDTVTKTTLSPQQQGKIKQTTNSISISGSNDFL